LDIKLNMVEKLEHLTSINLGYIGEQSSSFTYVYGGDLNGDRINEMIYYLFLRKRVIFVLFQYLKI
jgi:hypothetical protein